MRVHGYTSDEQVTDCAYTKNTNHVINKSENFENKKQQYRQPQ